MPQFLQNFVTVDHDYKNINFTAKDTFAKVYIQEEDFIEHFYMSEEKWTIEDYLQQWHHAWNHLKNNKKTCFIVTFQPHNQLIMTWTIYKSKKHLYIHNQFFSEKYAEEIINQNQFSPENSFFSYHLEEPIPTMA